MESKFTISEVLSTSWKCLKSQIWVLSGLLIGMSILSFTLSVLAMPREQSYTNQVVVALISLFIQLLFALGYMKNMFQALEGDEPQFSAYGQQARKIFTCFVASLIFGVILILGICLFIIPGIYLGIRLQFYIQFIVDEDAGILDSLKRSWEITEGEAMSLFFLSLAMIGVTLLGMVLFIVGIYVATPLVMMTQCYVYRKLMAPVSKEEW